MDVDGLRVCLHRGLDIRSSQDALVCPHRPLPVMCLKPGSMQTALPWPYFCAHFQDLRL